MPSCNFYIKFVSVLSFCLSLLLCVSAEAQPLSNASPAGKVKVEDLSPLETEPRPQARPTAPVTVETQGTTLKNKETISAAQIKAPVTEPQFASLSFAWNMPVSLAVFKRQNKLWIVFDHSQQIDIKELRNMAGDLAENIFQFPHPGATIIQLTPKEDVQFFVRKEGLLWIVDLFTSDQKPQPIKDMTIFTQYDSLNRPYLFIPTEAAGNIVSVIDPDVGDIITVAPTGSAGYGLNAPYHYPEFDTLATEQGLAFVIKAQDIMLNRGNTGLTLRAQNRGLNITEGLDALKRQQQFKTSEDSLESFDIKIQPQLLAMPYSEAVEQLKQDILSATPEQRGIARLELVKYYVSKGMGTNALYILNQMQAVNFPEAQSDKFHALLGVANFLAHRYDQAVENFEHGKLPEINEAIFWRTLASSAQEFKPENNVILFSFVTLIRDYPQELKDRIAVIGAENALNVNDDIAAQNFIDILKSGSADRLRNRKAQIDYLAAKKQELQGYPRNAIRAYREIALSRDQKYSSLARYDNAVLSQQINALSLNEAIGELEKLRFAWTEPKFKWELLNRLADFYVKNADYYNALKTLKETLPMATPDQRRTLLAKMVQWFEDIYINNQADNSLSAVKSLALYQDFEWLAARSKHQNEIIQKLADRLVAVDLLPRADKLLTTLLKKNDVSKTDRAKIGARLAVIYLFERKSPEALEILNATEYDSLPFEVEAHRRVIRARTMANLGQTDEALKLLNDDYSKNATLLKAEIFWNARQWGDAADAIKYLIEKPTPGKPLSQEQINYILDWATTLKKAGRETVLVRLRNKFMPYFAKTKYHSAFNILTDHLENDKIDLKEINSIVNDVQAFSDFAKAYNDSLKSTAIK